MVAEGEDLPSPGRLVRNVSYGKMRKDENDNFIGPEASAFARRDSEAYLSVTWCEYFEGSKDEQLRSSIDAIRNSNLDVKPKACFCVAPIDNLFEAISYFGAEARAVYYPEHDNIAHAGVYGISPDETFLLEQLAPEVWSDFLTKQAADALPVRDCF